jgi:small subunit ribosomal protein S1
MDKDNIYQPSRAMEADLQKELDEALGDMSLDELLQAEEASTGQANEHDPGQGILKGRVIAVSGDDVFVDIGRRHDGLLPAEQFRDEPLPQVGDEIEVTIEGFDQANGLIKLSRQGAVLAATWDSIAVGQVVEARATGYNKGGLELVINGIDAFMPISQVDTAHIEDLKPFVNTKLECLVQRVDFNKESVVVSRRELLKLRAAQAAEELWETIHEGQIVQGCVRSIMPYGAFVDIGGIDGLLHVKDLAHGRVEKVEDVLHVGQELELCILKLDREAKRVGLGLKQTLQDPWDDAEVKWQPGATVSGRVVKLMDFGAFVELVPGVEGLVPIGEISFRRIGHPREVVQVGDMLKVAVMSVDPEKKRISLSLKQAGDDPWQGAAVRWAEGSVVAGSITRLAEFGAFVELTPGVEGLVHISELSPKRVATVASVVSPGQAVQVKVLEVDEERQRISLSIKQVQESDAMPDAMSLADYEKQSPASKSKKNLKGGLDSKSVKTKFGNLNIG